MDIELQESAPSTVSDKSPKLEITSAFPTSISAEPASCAAQTTLITPTHDGHSSRTTITASLVPQTLETVPDDILLCIFRQLDVPMRELKCMKGVCKRWSSLIVKWEPILKVGRNVFVTCEELDMMLLNEV